MKKTIPSSNALWSLLVTLFLGVSPLFAQKPAKVTIEKPGELAEKIQALGLPTVTSLQVVGAINGKDIATLRQLAGGAFDATALPEGGSLSYLDLRKATFHVDGEKYSSHEKAVVHPEKIGNRMFASCVSLQTIYLPKGITAIEEKAFSGCIVLEEVRNTTDVTLINTEAFERCSKLSYISFPEGLTKIGLGAFKACTSLKGVVLPQSLVDIGSNAFEGSGICFVSLPEASIDLGSAIFKNCTSLAAVQILGAISSVPTSMFAGCSALQYVSLPASASIISSSAFEDCSSLENLSLPADCNYIQAYAFSGCKSLRQLVIPFDYDVVVAFSAFDSKNEITAYVPQPLVESYKSSEPWSSMTIKASDIYQEHMILEEDFDAYATGVDAWKGNDLWMVTEGAYIRSQGNNIVLKLGDNEGAGAIATEPLNLSGNHGEFRIKLAADGWNDYHTALQIEVKEKDGTLITSYDLTIPAPQMGAELKLFDIPFWGGKEETILVFSTTAQGRIAFLDNIEIYQSNQPHPLYLASSELVDWGRIDQGDDTEDVRIYFFGMNLAKAPKARIVSKFPRVFTVDSEIAKTDGILTLMLESENIGKFDGYLRIDYEGVNQLWIPLKAIVQDPENVFNLDDSNPITELAEDFNNEPKLPKGWNNIVLEGTRPWLMRTTGAGGNRYPAIDALGDIKGKVHSLLVLPALDFRNGQLDGKELIFNLATLKADGAKLHLVSVAKTGEITLLKDLTKTEDQAWQTEVFSLAQVALDAVGFLAFEYIGEAGSKQTIYRLDDVAIRTRKNAFSPNSNRVVINRLPQGICVSSNTACTLWIFALDGRVVATKHLNEGENEIFLPKGSYILRMEGSLPTKLLL